MVLCKHKPVSIQSCLSNVERAADQSALIALLRGDAGALSTSTI
jgi:hypothetical protein